MCTEQVDLPIPSCQSICEEVRDSCSPVLMKFNFQWPSPLNCSKFPSPEKNGLCIQFPNTTDEKTVHDTGRLLYKNQVNDYLGERTFIPSCPPKFTYIGEMSIDNLKFIKVGGNNSKSACAPKCGADIYFSSGDKVLISNWMTIWATICFVSTFFTLLTCCLEIQRFKYPERPVVLQALCYSIVSTAYIIRYFLGSEAVTCSHSGSDESVFIFDGMDNGICVILFLLQYYFGVAACLWWVMMTMTWYLSAAKKWSSEALSKSSSWFHLISWGIPAVQTLIVLTLRKIDGDELTGLCYVDNTDGISFLAFVIMPLSVYLIIGILFMILGIGAMVRIRQTMQFEGRNFDKFDSLMMKIGAFSIAYLIPAVAIIGCYLYEYNNRSVWATEAKTKAILCHKAQLNHLKKFKSECDLENSIPSIEMFSMKIFMSLVVGATSSLWVLSRKTWITWKRFLKSIFCCVSPTEKRIAVSTVPLQTVDTRLKNIDDRRFSRSRMPSIPRSRHSKPEHISQMETLVTHV
ncbi:frizzled-9-like isoform X2 [Artemia franciscana]